jgi:tetratricopeptide (TPR) repeat protein
MNHGRLRVEDSRIEFLEKSLLERPGEPFLRYALALELSNGGRLEEAWTQFARLLQEHPDYGASYYQAGKLLVQLGRYGEARAILTRGIEIAGRQGNLHARGELEAALADLPDE